MLELITGVISEIVLEKVELMTLRPGATRLWGRRLALFLLFVGTSGCGGGTPLPAEDPSRMTIRLTSSAFKDGGVIPKLYTCDGVDRSPPLEWSDVPGSAHSLVLICDDPDAPRGTWSHWVVYNMAPQVKTLKSGLPPDVQLKLEGDLSALQGKNDFGKIGYGGPCPPRGTHRYFFRLYAIDTLLDLGPTPTRSTVLRAIEGHIVAEGRLMGTYAR
jgi:Raf kinase inhibitor-like YbhB/YbcL family protein